MLIELAKEQHRAGHQVSIYTQSSRGTLTPAAVAAGIEVREFGLRSGPLAGRGKALWELARAIRSRREGIVHSWMYHSGIFALLFSRIRARVIVSIHHDDPTDRRMSRSTRMTARLLARLGGSAGAYVYVSESSREKHELHGFVALRSIVIPGGVDEARFTIQSSACRAGRRRVVDPVATTSSIVVVHVSRDHPDKDPRGMLGAFLLARRTETRLRLWMLGRGFDRENSSLLDGFDAEEVASSVRLLGESAHPEDIIGAADVIAVSSRTESFGLALVEGMLSGLAPASTAVGVAPELVNVDQLSAPDDLDGLANAILSAAAHQGPHEHRDRALAFGLTTMSARYSALYERVLREKDAR